MSAQMRTKPWRWLFAISLPLVVSDIAMPDKDGFELLREIRSLDLPQKIPVIAITGLSRPLDQIRAPAAGFDALLIKPFTPEALLRVISEVLEV